VIDNGVEVSNNMLKVRVSESLSLTLSQIQFIVGAQCTIIYDGEELDPK
jgi:hypothetical protein